MPGLLTPVIGKQTFRDVLGGGKDISSENPLIQTLVPPLPHLSPLIEYDKLVLEPTETWEKDDIHRAFILAYGADVILYYQAARDSDNIGYAKSTNFRDFTKQANPIVSPPAGQEIGVPGVLRVASDDWRMWVDTRSDTTNYLRYYTSADGIAWTESGSSPLLTRPISDWFLGFDRPRVIWHPKDQQFIMIHNQQSQAAATGQELFQWTEQRVGFSNDGLSWSFPNPPLKLVKADLNFLGRMIWVNQFFMLGDVYVIVFEAVAQRGYFNSIAYSYNLTDWFFDLQNSIFSMYDWSGWARHADPSIIPVRKGLWYCYHCFGCPPMNPGKKGVGLTILTEDGEGKDFYPILEVASLAGGAKTTLADCQAIHLDLKQSVNLTIEETYDSLATSGAKLYLYTSADGTNYDTEPVETKTLAFSAGATKRETFTPADSVQRARSVKAIIENLDATYALTSIKILATLGG